MAIDNIKQAVLEGARIEPSCEVLGITARTYRRWMAQIKAHGKTLDARPQAARERFYKHSITPEIRQRIIDLCLSEEFCMLPPAQIVPILGLQGLYIASESTFYRIMRAENLLAKKINIKSDLFI